MPGRSRGCVGRSIAVSNPSPGARVRPGAPFPPAHPRRKETTNRKSEELPCQLLDSLFNQRPTYRSIRPRTDPSPPSPFRLDSHEGPHRGGAGKGGWGKPGDELNAPKEGDEAEAEPEPEEPDNEISIEDFEAAKAAKKAAINAAMSKGAKAKEVDSSAFASMTLAAKNEDVNEFSLDGPGPKAKRERERKEEHDRKYQTNVVFEAGDRVLLLQPGRRSKMELPYVGPFRILWGPDERDRYALRDMEGRAFNEFHVSKLKLWPADVSRLAAGLFILVLSLPKVTQPLAKNKNKDQPTASQALIINFGEEQP